MFDLSAEAKVRYTGAALQLGGIATAVWALRSVADAVVDWFRELSGSIGRPTSVVVGAAILGATTRLFAPRVTVTPRRDSEIQDRLSAAEERISGLQSELDDRVETFRREVGSVQQELQEERRQRATADEAVQTIIDAAQKGHSLQLVGLVWLAIGVVLTSASAGVGSLLSQWMSRS